MLAALLLRCCCVDTWGYRLRSHSGDKVSFLIAVVDGVPSKILDLEGNELRYSYTVWNKEKTKEQGWERKLAWHLCWKMTQLTRRRERLEDDERMREVRDGMD